jgi:hypothetical protein
MNPQALRIHNELFSSFFAVQRASSVTIPSRWTRIPTWGREQARNRIRPVRAF